MDGRNSEINSYLQFVCIKLNLKNIKLQYFPDSETYIIDEPITKELLEQSSKIARTISRPNTHLMIIAQPSGRHIDALYIASTQLQAKVLLPQGVKEYNLADFYNDLKLV